jgi:CRP/FNR family transcriptional regulator, cyclic AMP receptor protein
MRRMAHPASPGDVAAYVGAALDSVNRQLQQWRQQGILEIRRGRILLLNANRLRAEAREG